MHDRSSMKHKIFTYGGILSHYVAHTNKNGIMSEVYTHNTHINKHTCIYFATQLGVPFLQKLREKYL